MKSQESAKEETQETKSEGKRAESRRCCSEGMPEMMVNWCESMGAGGSRSENRSSMMANCCEGMKKACRWMPLIPILLAGVAFLLGYYLDPEIVRVLWLIVSGFVVLMGIIGLTIASTIRFGSFRCC